MKTTSLQRRLAICAVVVVTVLAGALSSASAAAAFQAPPSPRVTLDFNSGWKFFREDAGGADSPAFDDGKWQAVTTPHTFDDVDSFRTIISHGGGDRGTYLGMGWYRKHFKLPADYAGRKVFIEF